MFFSNFFTSNFLRAISILIGTTIGAGIFAIPYVTAKSGFLIGIFWLIVLTIITLFINLAYGKVIVKTAGDHQLTGYGKIYFGNFGKWLSFAAILIGQYGALLAYIIGTGKFLGVIFSAPEYSFLFSFVFFAIGASILYFGLSLVSKLEGIVVLLMIILLFSLVIFGFSKIDPINYQQLTINNQFFFPFGVIFCALAGYAVIPEMEEVLRKERQKLAKAIVFGTLIPAFVYLIFMIIVIGVCGAQTSEEAIAGLIPFFSPMIVKIGAVFGILAMGSSFLTLSFVLRETFFRDFSLPKRISWALSTFPPFILFIFGARSFVGVLSASGTLMGFLTTALIFSLYLKTKLAKAQRVGLE